jgi:feruloyl-CoA hydratase/lyase
MSTKPARPKKSGRTEPWGKTVKVEFENGIAWVIFNRPDKRNAFSADLAFEMMDVLDALEGDERCGVLVFTGAGEAWSAGMDLRDYFRATDNAPPAVRARVYRANWGWQWRRLLHYPKPTIAMVNGWCFGGAFTPLVACDLAIAAEDATFGLSEINWGIIPAGVVSKAVATVINRRDALYYIMTGETFDGRRAAAMGLVNEAVPKSKLRKRTVEFAAKLLEKNPTVLRQAKVAFKFAADMHWEEAADYLIAKSDQAQFLDPERGRDQGMKQFLDEKAYRPGLENYRRSR